VFRTSRYYHHLTYSTNGVEFVRRFFQPCDDCDGATCWQATAALSGMCLGLAFRSESVLAEAPGGEWHVLCTCKPQSGTSRARSRYVERFTLSRTCPLISRVMRILGWARNDAQPLKERTALQLRRSLSGARCALRTRPVFSGPLPRGRKLLHQTYSAYCFRFLGVRYGATCCWCSVLASHEFHLSLKIDGIRMG